MNKQLTPVTYFSGTSGLVLPYPNKSLYPEEFRDKSRLEFYGSLFNSIEINSSFYKIPRGATIQNWVLTTPPEFRFTFKLWKGITHSKELLFNREELEQFMLAISHAGDKKGCMLIQFPPSLTSRMIMQVERLLYAVEKANIGSPWPLALEFRHASWYQPDILEKLEELNTNLVLHDHRSGSVSRQDFDGQVVYLRFHGPDGDYRGTYQDDFIAEYAGYIRDWREEGKTVYVYFNNTMGNAIQNLTSLNTYVQSHET